MKKAPPDARQAGLDARESVPDNSHRSYRITEFRRVAHGSKVAEFAIEIAGLGEFDLDVFAPPAKPAFVMPRSFRDKFTGAFRRVFRLDADLLAELLEAILPRLEADD